MPTGMAIMTVFAGSREKKILILIEDGSYLFDNRVKREAATLKQAGYQVLVICPRYPNERAYDVHNDVHVYRYKKCHLCGHLGEYLSALILGGLLTLKVWRQHGGFDCIQTCNPPDIWFLIAFFFKKLKGVKFVFDQHDICPELFLSRFGGTPKGLGYRAMLLLEKLTFKLSDGVISTNQSYKQIAMTRGGIAEKRIRVVRNGPDLNKFIPLPPDPQIRNNKSVVVGYLGNMNPQDGVDHLLSVARIIVHDLKRTDFLFIFIGSGDAFKELVSLKTVYALEDAVVFTGRIPDEEMLKTLSSCDICVQPDPLNPLNNKSTMNKVMEYMALSKPVVAYDLVETRYSCGGCALYAKPNEPYDLSTKILTLADDEHRRIEMGAAGRKRVETVLAWDYSKKHLLDIYDMVLG
jgi:glycosyltransferase involved in cell wall biosynthesis